MDTAGSHIRALKDMIDSQIPHAEDRPRKDDRLVLVGTTGAGKTTMAKTIAQALDMDHIEFDAIRHGPSWTETPDDVFRKRLRQHLQGDRWIGDGNYSLARDVVWPKATMLIWLDYPIRVVLWRLFWRTMRRGVLREELWHGNREQIWRHFFSRQSLFLWALQTHWRRRRSIPAALAHPDHAHLDLVHLRSPKAADEWLVTMTQRQ